MKKLLKFIIIGLVALLLLLCTTQPARLPSVVLIVPFILLFMILTAAGTTIIGWKQGIVTQKSMRRAALGAVLPTLLLVLQSVGQLTIRDAATIFILSALVYFYLSKMRATAL